MYTYIKSVYACIKSAHTRIKRAYARIKSVYTCIECVLLYIGTQFAQASVHVEANSQPGSYSSDAGLDPTDWHRLASQCAPGTPGL